MYQTTAFLYEATAAFEQPEKACEDIQGILLRCGIPSSGLLGDLGSGTGLMSVLLAEQGWHTYGIELSPAMLAVAQEKTAGLPVSLQERLTWIQGDITAFELPSGVQWDGAVSLCNTINHLADWSAVEGFIRATFRALKPNGVLILDSDTLRTFQCFFNHEPVVVWDDGVHRLTRACQFDGDSGRAHHVATLEQYGADGLTLVSEEAMPLQYHRETDLFAAFLEAGFQLESAEPYNPNPKLYDVDFVPKLLWVLRKPPSA